MYLAMSGQHAGKDPRPLNAMGESGGFATGSTQVTSSRFHGDISCPLSPHTERSGS